MPARRATSQDVAELAGVSRTTVSFVLNNVPGASISVETRQRVMNAVKRLDYHPDVRGRMLVSGKSYTLGLILLQSPEQVFADAFLLQVLLGVEQAAAGEGFYVLIKLLEPNNIDGYTTLIQENHVDGIILSGPRQDDQEIIRLHQEGVPILLMGQLPDSDIPYVDIDAIEGATIAVQHLIELGHQDIGLITNASLKYTSAHQRRLGYRQALERAGLKENSLLIREGSYTPASGYQAMLELLEVSPRPTAVFVTSDIVALGVIQAIKQSGLRIPEDIAVVGFDDIPSAGYFDPPLTTLRLPAYALGWSAGERLVSLAQEENLDQVGLLLETQLVVRESTVGKAAS